MGLWQGRWRCTRELSSWAPHLLKNWWTKTQRSGIWTSRMLTKKPVDSKKSSSKSLKDLTRTSNIFSWRQQGLEEWGTSSKDFLSGARTSASMRSTSNIHRKRSLRIWTLSSTTLLCRWRLSSSLSMASTWHLSNASTLTVQKIHIASSYRNRRSSRMQAVPRRTLLSSVSIKV